MQHRYNRDSPHCLYLVPSNLPKVNQSIIDTSKSLEHDYPTTHTSTEQPRLQPRNIEQPRLQTQKYRTTQIHLPNNCGTAITCREPGDTVVVSEVCLSQPLARMKINSRISNLMISITCLLLGGRDVHKLIFGSVLEIKRKKMSLSRTEIAC